MYLHVKDIHFSCNILQVTRIVQLYAAVSQIIIKYIERPQFIIFHFALIDIIQSVGFCLIGIFAF